MLAAVVEEAIVVVLILERLDFAFDERVKLGEVVCEARREIEVHRGRGYDVVVLADEEETEAKNTYRKIVILPVYVPRAELLFCAQNANATSARSEAREVVVDRCGEP